MNSRRLIIKLLAPFAALILVIALAGGLALARMSAMRSELDTIVNQRWEHTSVATEAIQLSSANNRITLLTFLLTDAEEIARLLAERDRNSGRISSLLARASQTVSPAERKLIDVIKERRITYVDAYRDATQLLLDGKREEANRRMTSEVLPLLNEYHAAWEAFRMFQREETEELSRIIAARFVNARWQLIWLLVAGIALTTGMAVFETRGSVRELAAQGRLRSLEGTREELERRVAERTADLQRANAELQEAAAELSAAHESLRVSEAQFRTLSDAAPIGVFLTDGKGSIVFSNPYCRRFTGIQLESASAEEWMRCIHPNDFTRVKEAIDRSCRDGGDFECEYRLVNPSGQTRWLHSRAVIIRGRGGEVAGRVGTALDITERKQTEAEVERVHRELLKASREAGIAEVATGVLHNVKNVVNSMNVSASVLEAEVNKLPSAGLAKAAAMLAQNSTQIATFMASPKGKLLPSYLDQVARSLEEQQRTIRKELQQFQGNVQHIKEIVSMQQSYATPGSIIENIDPLHIMEDSLRFNLGALSRHGIRVVRQFESNLPHLWVEKHKVLQILVNFIRNAKHACQASTTPDKTVSLGARRDGDFVIFSVTDNGVGIDADQAKRLFEYGFTTKKNGHGFGLHSAALAARELGGEVTAHSDGTNRGACFILRLPVSPKPENAENETAELAVHLDD